MKKILFSVFLVFTTFNFSYAFEWKYIEFPVRISNAIAVAGRQIFVPSLDTNVLSFILEKELHKDTFNIKTLDKTGFFKDLVNFDTVYDTKLRLFQGYLGGTIEYSTNGYLWLVGLCAFKNIRGQDSLVYKLYVFKDEKFVGIPSMLFTTEMDTIAPLRSTRLLGSGNNGLPWIFESRILGDTTIFLLAYAIETTDGFAFIVKDTISFVSSLRVYFNGADVDNFGNLSYITNELLKTISTKKTLRELRIDQMFPQASQLCGLKIDKRSGNIYIFDRGFNLIKFDGNSWTFNKLPIVDTFPLDARKNALVAIDSSGNLWVTMSSYFKHLYKISSDGLVTAYPLPKEITGTLGGTLQVDNDGILYLVANKLYPDSSIKPVLYYLDTKEVMQVEEKIPFQARNNLFSFVQAKNKKMQIEFPLNNENNTSEIKLDLFNLFGEKLNYLLTDKIIFDNPNGENCKVIELDLKDFPEGIYFVKVCRDSFCKFQKIILIN